MNEHSWTPAGKELLKQIDQMICDIGTSKILADIIISENPEYFRNFCFYNRAKRQLVQTYDSRKEHNIRLKKKWSIAEDEIIRSTFDRFPKQIIHLLPRRSLKAINMRRIDLRKNMLIVPDAPRYFGA
jgi:hypothetical protein